MKKYIIGAVFAVAVLLLGSQDAMASIVVFGSQGGTPIAGFAQTQTLRVLGATSLNPADPTAPFLLSGVFTPLSINLNGSQAFGCFQIRTAAEQYGSDCTTTPHPSQLGTTIVGAPQIATFLNESTGDLLPNTTYFVRVLVKNQFALIPGFVGGGSDFASQDFSFVTPAAKVLPPPAPAPTPVPVPVPQPVTTLTVTPEQSGLVVAGGVPNQKIASFSVNVGNEPVTVKTIRFHFELGGFNGPLDSNLLTGVTLVDAAGRVIDGPFDVRGTTDRVVDFGTVGGSSAITFPQGVSTYAFKATIPVTAGPRQTITVTTNLATDWNIPKGTRSGKIVPLTGVVRLAPATVKTPRLDLSLTSTGDKTVLAGTANVSIESYLLDATESSEDARVTTFAVPFTPSNGGVAADLVGCALFDGATALTTNPPVVEPVLGLTRFTLTRPLVVAKGTSKSIALKCTVATSARGSYSFGLTNSSIAIDMTTGTTNRPLDASITPTLGGNVTAQIGTLVLSSSVNNPNFPASQSVRAGTTDFRVGIVKFKASNEAIRLERVGFTLLSGAPQSVVRVTITDNGTPLGFMFFGAGSRSGTSTLVTPIVIPANTEKELGIKVDFAPIGAGLPGIAGDRVQLSVVSNSNTQGTGLVTGAQVLAIGTANFNTFTVR